MIQPHKKIFESLQGLHNIPELVDIPIWFVKPSAQIGDLQRFIVYSVTSSDDLEADDLTFFRQFEWTILFYTANYGEDIADDLETCLNVPVSLERSYEDPVAGMMVHAYTFTK